MTVQLTTHGTQTTPKIQGNTRSSASRINAQSIKDNQEGLYDEETNIDDDGNPQTARRLKRGVNYTWTWSGTPPNRILIVSFTGPGASMTPQQKNGLTNALNARFGSNKIVLA